MTYTSLIFVCRSLLSPCSQQSLRCVHIWNVTVSLKEGCSSPSRVGVCGCLSFHALLFRVLDIIVSFPLSFLHFTFGKGIISSNTFWGGGAVWAPEYSEQFGPEKHLLNSAIQGFENVVWLTQWTYFGHCPSSKLQKRRRFGSRLCFHFQETKHFTRWTPYSQSLGNIATLIVFRYAPEEWWSLRGDSTWYVIRRISEQVECWYGAQWLGIAGSRESIRWGASFPGHMSRGCCRNVLLFKMFD